MRAHPPQKQGVTPFFESQQRFVLRVDFIRPYARLLIVANGAGMDGRANGNQGAVQAPVRQILRLSSTTSSWFSYMVLVRLIRFPRPVPSRTYRPKGTASVSPAGAEAEFALFHLFGHESPTGQQLVELGHSIRISIPPCTWACWWPHPESMCWLSSRRLQPGLP